MKIPLPLLPLLLSLLGCGDEFHAEEPAAGAGGNLLCGIGTVEQNGGCVLAAGKGGGDGGAGAQGGQEQGGESGAGQGGCSTGELSQSCKSNAECLCDQVCSQIGYGTAQISCQDLQKSGSKVGEACSENMQCVSNACDFSAKTCTFGCQKSEECGVGNACGRTYFSSEKFFDQCFKRCHRDSDCPTNAGGTSICMLRGDWGADTVVFACAYLGFKVGDTLSTGGFVRGFGEEKGPNDLCYSDISLLNNLCTKACESDSDCGGKLPNCKQINVPRPSKNGTTLIKACTE